MALRVYGIPNCASVKKARDWLDARRQPYVFHDYKKAGIGADTVRAWLAEVPLDTLLNRRGTTWRALDDASRARAATEDGAIALMVAQPSLIKRPVLVAESDAVTGARPAARVLAVGFAPDVYAALHETIDEAMTAR
ncbi:MAG: Spx/MgsR family RNA polymerase-binding regulatory protein [Janthinobacterium lividum]